VLIYWAQIQVSSGLAAVLFATYPFWVAIYSHFFLPNERITFARIIGLIIGFLGVVFIFNNGFSEVNMKTYIGMIVIIIGSIIQAYGLVAIRKYGGNYHPVILNFWPMFFSILPLFVASYVFEDYSCVMLTNKSIGSILYLSIFCTVVTFVIYFWLIKHVEAVILSLSAFITPIIAVLIGVVFINEKLTGNLYIGSLLVLIGVASATIGDLITLFRHRVK
jgi:drug/metabolite transporter (DMT)-like permease